jgi:hypothetical protein
MEGVDASRDRESVVPDRGSATFHERDSSREARSSNQVIDDGYEQSIKLCQRDINYNY